MPWAIIRFGAEVDNSVTSQDAEHSEIAEVSVEFEGYNSDGQDPDSEVAISSW